MSQSLQTNIDDSVELTLLRLQYAEPFPKGITDTTNPISIDGILGRDFAHQHHELTSGPNDDPRFQYPRLQVKCFEDEVNVVGLLEASQFLRQWWDSLSNELDQGSNQILHSEIATNEFVIAATEEPQSYEFLTPWLALNRKNFQEYSRSRSQSFRREKLRRTLVGNVLGMCQALGVQLNAYVDASTERLMSIKVPGMGGYTMGFVGRFAINVQFPDRLGLGRGVAFGSGTIQVL